MWNPKLECKDRGQQRGFGSGNLTSLLFFRRECDGKRRSFE